MTTLHAFEIPEDDTALPEWLEAQLAGPYLGELAADLAMLREIDLSQGKPADGAAAESPTLDSALDHRVPQVCQRGLGGVSAVTIRRLFRHPDLLLELQSRILTDGGPYWDRKLQESSELNERLDDGWSRLTEKLGIAQPTVPIDKPTAAVRAQKPARPVRWFLSGLLTAAAMALVAFGLWDRFKPAQPIAKAGWGWNRPGSFVENASRADYLNGLADAAAEWRRKRPESPADLAQRIAEFRQGCSHLILAEHRPLPPADRKWLVERCQAWAKIFDQRLADVEAGKDVITVRNQMDTAVDNLVNKLRERAQSAPS